MRPRWLVFGARGYVGHRLVEALRAADAEIYPADIRPLLDGSGLVGDVRDAAYVERCFALARPNVVVHLASYGMSGGEMADAKLTWDVNVNGTRAVAQQCAKRGGATRLVYISTVNVCFSGQEVVGGDEQMPYVPVESHADGYSASKTVAEQIALGEAGGNAVALRPYGIYGDGEERHFPRMLRLFRWGLFMQIGSPDNLSDWVYVDNLVHAIRLAAAAPQQAVAGQAFFIGDGEPVNTIALSAPLWHMTSGAESGGLWVPYGVVYRLAHLCELLRIPLLSRAEGTFFMQIIVCN